MARNAYLLYQPTTVKGRIAWEGLRLACRFDLMRLLLKAASPPAWVVELLLPAVPEGGSYAVARSNHAYRYVAVTFNPDGAPQCVVKLALEGEGKAALVREEKMLRWSNSLNPPLQPIRVVGNAEGVLVTEFMPWRPRLAAWRFPPAVSYSLGQLFRDTQDDHCGMGYSHGDCAPWNLLRTRNAWALIDWESGNEGAPPFRDIFHFIFQSHSLLGRPSLRSIRRGLCGKGWVGEAITSYAQGASLSSADAAFWFTEYLHDAVREHVTPGSPSDAKARRILEMLGPIGRKASGQLIDGDTRGASQNSYRNSHLPAVNASMYEENVYSADSFDSWIWERERKLLLERIGPRVSAPCYNHLDFACGTGRILSFVEQFVETSTGVDISQAMLELASRKVRSATVVQGDITIDASLVPGPFDLITAFRFFLNAEDALKDAAIGALVERLAPNGTLITNVHGNKYSLRGLGVSFRRLVLKQPVNQLSYWKLRRKLVASGLRILEVRGLGMLPPKVWERAPRGIVDWVESVATASRLDRVFATNLILICRREV